jgi:hypothetical protein
MDVTDGREEAGHAHGFATAAVTRAITLSPSALVRTG